MQKRYTVVLFNDSLVGGAGKSILVLAEALKRKGVEVHIVIYENDVDYDIPNGIALHILQNIAAKNKKEIAEALQKKIKTLGNFDLVISNSTPSNKILSMINTSNSYHCVRSAETKRYSGVFKYVREVLRNRKYRKLYSNKHLITVSKGLEEVITEKIKAKPNSMQTIYEPFDFEHIKKRAEDSTIDLPDEPYLLHVGRFDLVSKRQDILLKAYKKSGAAYKLVFLGQGSDEEKIKQYVTELNLESHVIFPGFYDNPFPWIQQAKLFILSSDFEGFGRVLVEALALKIPVVSTDCSSGPSEILRGELSRYLVPTQDVDAMAVKIEEALEDYPEITDAMVEQFSDDKIAQAYITLIEERHHVK